MGEQLNQVVPSTSCDWLDQCDEDDVCSNQVVPARAPTIDVTSEENCNVSPPIMSSATEDIPVNWSPIGGIENSLKALSLEGAQVVPSASKSPLMESSAMNVESEARPKKLFRPTSKTPLSKV